MKASTLHINRQKNEARDLLDRLTLLDPSCAVLGGAPRNWHLGHLANDIDIFLYLPRNIQGQGQLRLTLKRLTGHDWKILQGDDGAAYEYKANAQVQDVYQAVLPSGQHVQVIRCSNYALAQVPFFPLSISQCQWHPEEDQVLGTKAFDQSVKHKVIWKTLDHYPDSHKYILKIRKQFPEHKYFSSRLAFLEWAVDNA